MGASSNIKDRRDLSALKAAIVIADTTENIITITTIKGKKANKYNLLTLNSNPNKQQHYEK